MSAIRVAGISPIKNPRFGLHHERSVEISADKLLIFLNTGHIEEKWVPVPFGCKKHAKIPTTSPSGIVGLSGMEFADI